MQIGDWLDDLAEFGAPIVAESVKRWRQDPEKGRKRPVPADIRDICIDLRRATLKQKAIGHISDAEKARLDEIFAKRIQAFRAFGRWEPGWGPRPE